MVYICSNVNTSIVLEASSATIPTVYQPIKCVTVYRIVLMEMMKPRVQCQRVLTCCDVIRYVFILAKYVMGRSIVSLVRMSWYVMSRSVLHHVSVVATP